MNATRLLAAILASSAAGAAAQQNVAVPEPGPSLRLDRGMLELRLGAQRLSAGYPDWQEATVLLARRTGAHLWQAELASLERFGARGTYASIMDTYTLGPRWYASVALAAGDGAFFLPKHRVDAFLYRKLLDDASLVAYAGVGEYRAPDGHRDTSVSLGASRYFEAPWVIQGGVRFNESRPGSVRTRQQFVAATYGRAPGDQLVARYGWGREGYLAIAPGSFRVDFESREASLQWRHPVAPTHGMTVALERYRNPFYERSGIALGYFVALP
ncbi:MAG TPA: YaiO family outer membrane beta-barrel protein [Usitatibacter sp.]|nr:YaiO family outer membrane beta-barrel protein [Usitatibacter sp.]